MAYWATQAELEAKIVAARLKNWGDKDRDGTIDATTLALAFQEAQAICSSYLIERFGGYLAAWTSTTVPWLIKSCYLDLSVWFFATGSNTISPAVQKRYETSLDTLKRIHDGELDVYNEQTAGILTEVTLGFADTDVDPETTRFFQLSPLNYGTNQTESVVSTPSDHNDLLHIQGGGTGEHYHLTAAQAAQTHAAVTVVDSSTVDFTLAGQALTAAVIPGGIALQHLANADFLHLSDTPDAYTGEAGKFVKVNAGETALEFTAGGGGVTEHSALTQLDYASAGHTGFEPTVSKGDLTAGSTKISIGGTGTGAVIGAGVSVDVNQSNLDHGSVGGLSDDDHTQYILVAGTRAFTGDQSLDNHNLTSVNNIRYNTSYTATGLEPIGSRYWDTANNTTTLVLPNSGLLQDGQEVYAIATNLSGGDVLDGVAVSLTSASGNRVAFTLTDVSDGNGCRYVGLTTEPIANNNAGRVTLMGEVHGLNTMAYTEGQEVYVNPSTPGALTATEPTAPNLKVSVGIVTVKHATEGIIAVQRRIIPKLQGLSDVDATGLDTTGEVLVWNQTATKFEAMQLPAAYVPIADNGGYFVGTEAESALQIIGKSRADSAHYSGFPNHADTSLSWDDGTYTLTLTASADKIWISGVEYTINTLTKQLSVAQEAASGVYWFWITAPGGVPQLNCDSSAPGFDKCLTATVYWNTTTSKGILSDERHWFGRDQKYHEYLHETVGARYALGMAGTFTSTTISIANGEFYDEDIEHTFTTQTTVKVLYHNGDADWAWDVLTTPYKVANPGVDNTLRYNSGNALASVTNNRYTNEWVFSTPDETHPIHVIIGTAEHTTLALARAAGLPSFGALVSPEIKLIYKITYQNNGGSPLYIEATDYRSSSNLPTGSYVATSHAALSNLDYATANHSGFEPTVTKGDLTAGSTKITIGGTGTGAVIGAGASVDVNQANLDHGSIGGLADDDHTQYALLAGRAGGQSLTGGTAAGDDLTLVSTANGTKGSLLFGTSAYDEVNNRLGLGLTSPNEQLELTGNLRLSALAAADATGLVYRGTARWIHGFFPTNATGRNFFAGENAGNTTMTAASANFASRNTGVGYTVLDSLTNGRDNTCLGNAAGTAISSGTFNVGIGSQALFTLTTNSYNVAVGYNSVAANGGNFNVGIGSNALNAMTSSNCTALGNDAGKLATGANNIFIGYNCGDNVTTAANCLLLGYDIDALSATTNGQLRIGSIIYGSLTAPESLYFQPTSDSTTFFQILDADGGTPIFNVDSTNERVGIGTAAPSTLFHAYSDSNALIEAIFQNANTGTAANTRVSVTCDTASGTIQSHAAARTATRYGVTLGGAVECRLVTGTSFLIGTGTVDVPIVFGINNTEVARMTGVDMGIGATAPESRLEVECASDYGKQAVTIDQDDADQAFIDFQGTSAASAANNISTWTTATLNGYIKVEINGTAKWIAYYNAPTS